MISNDTIRNVVSSYFSTLSAMDIDAWLALFEEEATGHDPGIPLLVGPDQLRAFAGGLVGIFATFSALPEEIFLCDSGAAVRWNARGTTKDGREVTFSGIEVFEVGAEGKIRWARAYWDPAGLMARLKG